MVENSPARQCANSACTKDVEPGFGLCMEHQVEVDRQRKFERLIQDQAMARRPKRRYARGA